MLNQKQLKRYFDQAKADFPYPHLRSLDASEWVVTPKQSEILYTEQVTFDAGHLLGEPIVGEGTLDLSYSGDDEAPEIVALFVFGYGDEDERSALFTDSGNLQGAYDSENRTWEFSLAKR